MKYAVTGATGLIGKALIQKLLQQGVEVAALYRKHIPSCLADLDDVQWIKGAVDDLESLEDCFQGCDGVFHVAGYTKPWAKEPGIYDQINVQGTKNVCQAAMECQVNRVVCTSSAGIHGPQQSDALINESTWPRNYFTAYEQSKFDAKKAAERYIEQGLEVVTVSPARVYAAEAPSKSNVPVRLLDIYLKKKFGVVPVDGNGIGSYVFMDDVVQGHWLAMQQGLNGEEYLLGGENLSYLEFYNIISRVTGKAYPVFKLPYFLSLVVGKTQLFMAETFQIEPTITTPWVRKYLQNWALDSTKIKALGYKVTPLEKGLKKVVESQYGPSI